MQLILTTQPTTDDIKMSTQTESPINRDLSEIKKEINGARSIDDLTIDFLKEDLSNGTDLPATTFSQDIEELLEEDRCLNQHIRENDEPTLKKMDIQNNSDLVENVNTDICDHITNEIPTENSGEVNLSNNDDLTIEEVAAVSPPNISDERLESLEIPDDKLDTKQPDISNDSLGSLETSDDKIISSRLNTSDESLEKLITPEKSLSTTNTIESLCQKDIAMSNENKEEIENVALCDNNEALVESNDKPLKNEEDENVDLCENNECLVKNINDTSSDINQSNDDQQNGRINSDKDIGVEKVKNQPEITNDDSPDTETLDDENLKIIDAKTPAVDDIVMDEEIIAVEPEIIDINNELNEDDRNAIEVSNLPSVDDSEDFTMLEDNKISDAENAIEVSNLTSVDDSEDFTMLEDNKISDTENMTLEQEDLKSSEIDEKIVIPVQESSLNDKNKTQDEHLDETIDISMEEIEMASPHTNDVGDDTKQASVDTIEEDSNTVNETTESSVNAVAISDDNCISDDKNKEKVDIDCMETDDVEIENLELDKVIDVDNNMIDATSSDVSNNKSTIIEDAIETNVASGVDLEKKASEESVIICEDVDVDDTNKNNSDTCEENKQETTKSNPSQVDILDEDEVRIVEKANDVKVAETQIKESSPEPEATKTLPVVCKLSNNLNILSEDEEESLDEETNVPISSEEKQCINLDDDDDIVLIEEDSNSKESISKDKPEVLSDKEETLPQPSDKIDLETGENQTTDMTDMASRVKDRDPSPEKITTMDFDSTDKSSENMSEEIDEASVKKKTLLPHTFLKTAKKSLASMTRHELEDFCILRIVESIVDRSNLSDIKSSMKTMAQNLEDYRKRALMMTKQNRDLQVVLKSVQEEQKKRTNVPIQPLKITRSVGMQVLMNDKSDPRRNGPIPTPVPPPNNPPRPVRSVQNAKQIKPPVTPPNIPVPRKVPVNNSPAKAHINTATNNIGNKLTNPNPNGLRNPSPVQKAPEKRPLSRMQVTVDLTDDEPPAKVMNKNANTPPVRVVPSQNLMAQNRQFGSPTLNSPRKVYIPISGPQNQTLRPGQTLMMKNIQQAPGSRPMQPRLPMPRPQQNIIRTPKAIPRHPAPLPDAMKQYTPPSWKALPPAPDLKLSKVENGIVISWKIDGYHEGNYETIASYQLYAYQETASPPCTALWKKIGDVKALPLPMACTLTQFMAGFKYYFAVRAVDIRSRLGPFSLPGSILLLNKV